MGSLMGPQLWLRLATASVNQTGGCQVTVLDGDHQLAFVRRVMVVPEKMQTTVHGQAQQLVGHGAAVLGPPATGMIIVAVDLPQ